MFIYSFHFAYALTNCERRFLASIVKYCQDSGPVHTSRLKTYIDQLDDGNSPLNILESIVVSLGQLAKFRLHLAWFVQLLII